MTSSFDNPGHMMTGANQVGEGWHPIIQKLEIGLNLIDPNYELLQVKEKFGGLRYYAQTYDSNDHYEQFHGLIRRAEEESFKTCEVCGTQEGVTTEGRWLKTLCPADRPAEA